MPRKKPLNNPYYTELFYIIFNGFEKPKNILKHINEYYKESRKREGWSQEKLNKLTKSNLSMKLQTLKNEGLIKGRKRGRHSRYKVDYEGILKYIIDRIIKFKTTNKKRKQDKERVIKNKRLQNWVKRYLDFRINLYVERLGKPKDLDFSKAEESRKGLPTLNSLMKDFVKSVITQDFSNRNQMSLKNLNRRRSKLSGQVSDKFLKDFYAEQTFKNMCIFYLDISKHFVDFVPPPNKL